MTNDGERCAAVLPRKGEAVRCDLPAEHDGTHSGHTGHSYVDWSTDTTVDGETRVAFASGPSEGEQPASYAQIAVDRCIYCRTPDIEIAFVFVPPHGLKVAVPGRVGLCGTCHGLLRDGDFHAVLERTRRTSLADFEDEAVLDLIRASRAALPE